MEFIERLKLELEDLQEFLRGLPLNLSDCKAGDFGCGEGYSTLSLMLTLDATECIGIDAFLGNALSPSLQSIQQTFNEVKTAILSASKNLQEDKVIREIRHLLHNGRFPMFKQDDIVQSHNLPNNFDFAFCKLVLGNIFTGEYDNKIKGEDGVNRAIQNIAKSTKQNGAICLVERDAMNFTPFLQNSHLTPLRICRISRGDIGTFDRLTSSASIVNYVVYLCEKH